MGGRGSSSSGGSISKPTDADQKYYRGTSKDSISSRQAGALYRAAKSGDIEMSDDAKSFMYGRIASDYPQLTANSVDSGIASAADAAVSASFAGDYGAAARWYNSAVDTYFSRYSDSIYTKDKKSYYIRARKG